MARKKEADARAKRLKMQNSDAQESEINCEQEKMHAVLKTPALLLKVAETEPSAAIASKDNGPDFSGASLVLQAANQKMSTATSSIQDTEAQRKGILARKRKLRSTIESVEDACGASVGKKSHL